MGESHVGISIRAGVNEKPCVHQRWMWVKNSAKARNEPEMTIPPSQRNSPKFFRLGLPRTGHSRQEIPTFANVLSGTGLLSLMAFSSCTAEVLRPHFTVTQCEWPIVSFNNLLA